MRRIMYSLLAKKRKIGGFWRFFGKNGGFLRVCGCFFVSGGVGGLRFVGKGDFFCVD